MSFSGYICFPPANLSFTTLNTNSQLTTSTVGNNIAFQAANSHSGDNLCGIYVAAPSTPYSCIMQVQTNPGDYINNNSTLTVLAGPGFYNGTTAVTMFNVWNNSYTMAMDTYNWTNTTTIGGTLAGNRIAQGYPTANLAWFLCRDDGTDIYFYLGTDGTSEQQPTHWVLLYSESRTSHFTSGPTDVGFFLDSNGTSSQKTYYSLTSFQTVGL